MGGVRLIEKQFEVYACGSPQAGWQIRTTIFCTSASNLRSIEPVNGFDHDRGGLRWPQPSKSVADGNE